MTKKDWDKIREAEKLYMTYKMIKLKDYLREIEIMELEIGVDYD